MEFGDERPQRRGIWDFHTFGISAWTVTGDEEPVPPPSHAQRAAAIRAVLVPRAQDVEIDWGMLDASVPQRLVEVSLTVYPPFDLFGPADPGLRGRLTEAGAPPELANCIAGLTGDLVFEQFRKRLGRFVLNLGNGVRITVLPGHIPQV